MAEEGEVSEPKSPEPGTDKSNTDQLITIPQTTPRVYYFHPVTGEVLPEPLIDDGTFLIFGNINEIDFEGADLSSNNGIRTHQFSGYAPWKTPSMRIQEIVEDNEDRDNQKINPYNSWLNRKEEGDLRKPLPLNPDKDYSRKLKYISLLPVRMPKQFNYTTAISRNNVDMGLLHSLIRHYIEWKDFIPKLEEFKEKVEAVPAFKDCFDEVGSTDRNTSSEALKQFKAAFKSEINKLHVAKIFSNMQFLIYDFIQQHADESYYQGERINSDNLQVLFRTIDKCNQVNAMTLCLSKEIFEPDPKNTGDERPYRTIITVYFRLYNDRESLPQAKMFYN